ncbi:MAG: DNA translocase FtsK [Planctomycetia bacterium]|nr:DNA translocase FtsK [Planctomycetia bacterium]
MAFADRTVSQRFAPPARVVARPVVEPAASVTAATRNRVRDLTALVLLAGCIFLVAALATFDAGDPPTSRVFPPHARAINACGLLGAAVAGTLIECFGIGAWCVVAFVAALDAALLRRRALPDLPLRTAGAILATVGVCTLLTLFLPDWVGRPLWGPGGRVGGMGGLLAGSNLAQTGAAIIVTALTFGGLFLACDTAILWLARSSGTLAVACTTACSMMATRLARRRTVSDAFDAEQPDLADRFPGMRSRLAGRGDAEADLDSDDAEGEPTIRVKRRELPVAAAADLEDETIVEDADLGGDAGEDAVPAAPQPLVPIRSLSNRRKPQPTLELSPDPAADYELPSLDLLLPTEYLELDQQEQEVRDRAKVLEKTFAEFGFKVKVVEVETGPVISQYEIELEAGLRLAKITNLADDLAIALRVPSVRIVAPIPGKNSVGIEVPNTTRQMVRLREVIEETQAKSRTMKIPIYLGKDVAGNPMVVDMASMPHLLIAGRTGTGKSVCLNSIIVSMLMTRRPDEVRMLMIDPKMVELTPYKSLPHLMHPVVTDMKKAEAILAWAVEKMEQRYALLAKVGVRHLTQYNALGRETILERMRPESEEEAAAIPTTMPFIVMIADEIADMMMTAGKEIEAHIIRLAQKSRAVGIHLILATQKPTVDVITGLIKSNLPARIAFQVASRTDSRVVLDEMGAERLLGNGDMLFLSPGTSQILRGQGTYLSDEEIGRVMGAIGTSEPQYAAELVNLQPAPSGDAGKAGVSPKDKDDLYEAAVEVVIREGRGSVSLLQRALGVGYGRGARLIDFMAEDGVVGQYAGSQAREVLITMDQWAERTGSAPLPPDPTPRKLKIQPHASAPAVIDADETGDADEDFEDDDAGFEDGDTDAFDDDVEQDEAFPDDDR